MPTPLSSGFSYFLPRFARERKPRGFGKPHAVPPGPSPTEHLRSYELDLRKLVVHYPSAGELLRLWCF